MTGLLALQPVTAGWTVPVFPAASPVCYTACIIIVYHLFIINLYYVCSDLSLSLNEM
jgi:hypothetical protein